MGQCWREQAINPCGSIVFNTDNTTVTSQQMKWITEKVFTDTWPTIRRTEGDACSKVKHYFLWNRHLNNHVHCFSSEWHPSRKVPYKKQEGKAGTTHTNKQARIFNTGTAQNFGKLFILTINHVSFVIKLLKLRFQLWATC